MLRRKKAAGVAASHRVRSTCEGMRDGGTDAPACERMRIRSQAAASVQAHDHALQTEYSTN